MAGRARLSGHLSIRWQSLTGFNPDGDLWVRPLLEDKAGNCWFGSPNKILRYDGNAFHTFAEKEINGWIFYMAETKDGNLWFGNTFYDGKTLKHFSKKDGFCFDKNWCVMADRKGNIWFTDRNRDLCRYDGKTFTGFSVQ